MEQRQIEVLIEQAGVRMRMADWRGAIDLLRRALALDPDHARAHATLGLALRGAKRLAGAEIETRMALHLDGNDPFCHYAAASVLCAKRELKAAWDHCLVALETDSTDVATYVLGAVIRGLRSEPAEARELLGRALELEPNDSDALTELARIELHEHRYAEAARVIDQALRATPGDRDAHIVAGYIDLVRGDDVSAEQHCRFALEQDATDREALQLWAAIKAHRNPVIGLWWRLNAFVSLRSEAGQVGLMIGSFVVAQIAIILAGAFGLYQIERFLRWGWLGFCAYTWIAPEIYQWMLKRDLGRVELDPEF